MRAWKLLLAAWRAFYVYSEIWIAGVLYMRRWRLMPAWLPGVRLHNILVGDDDRALHDHPFSFVTIILRGGYWEHLVDGSRTWHGPGSILFRQAEVFHRIELGRDYIASVDFAFDDIAFIEGDRPAWTLVFRGPYRRQWGFLTKDGWVHNNKFVSKREGKHSDQGGQQ